MNTLRPGFSWCLRLLVWAALLLAPHHPDPGSGETQRLVAKTPPAYECVYTGTITGNQAVGSFGCNRFSGQKPWRATIQGGGYSTGR